VDTLLRVVEKTHWQEAARDVQRFLGPRSRKTTVLWNGTLFSYHVRELAQYL
jgi:hypothetical protein